MSVYRPPVHALLDPAHRIRQLFETGRVLRRFMNSGRYHVLETATMFPGAVIAQVLPARRGVGLVCHALGDDINRPLRTAWAAGWFRRALLGVDRFVAISRYTQNRLVEAGVDAARIVRVRPPLDAVRFGVAGRGATWRSTWPQHSHVLLTLCQLTPKKGVDRVLEALPMLLGEVPGLLYVVAGDGPDRERLESLADRMGVRPRVCFAGRVAPERLADLYAAADVFVMPTRSGVDGSVEGFGIVFLEAGSQGVPVVGPRVGGSADAIIDGETGFLVDANDSSDIAQALRLLLLDADVRRRLGEAGRRNAFVPTDWLPALNL